MLVMLKEAQFAAFIFDIRGRMARHRVAPHAVGCRVGTGHARRCEAMGRSSSEYHYRCRAVVGSRYSLEHRLMDANRRVLYRTD